VHKKNTPNTGPKSFKRFTFQNPAIFIVLFTLLICTPIFAFTGQVINQTTNRPEPDIEVSYIRHAAGDVSIVRDTTNSKGQFVIDAPADPGADPPPMLLARYKGIDYPGNPTPTGDTVDISVFEITDSDSAISIGSHHIILNTQEGTVTYIVITHNHSNRTYLTGGDHGHGLELRLPDGVTEIINAPQGVHLHGSVLVDPRPIIPGNSQTFFSFPIPTSNRLHHSVTYPTNTLDVLVQPPESPVTITGLQDLGTVNLGNNTFHRWSTSNLAVGAHIAIALESPSTLSDPQTLPWILGASAFAIAMLAAVIHLRYKTPQPSPTAPASDRRTMMLEQIANLDERFENGELSEKDYQARRDALKAEIVDLDKELAG
jgi:hypothetical protein